RSGTQEGAGPPSHPPSWMPSGRPPRWRAADPLPAALQFRRRSWTGASMGAEGRQQACRQEEPAMNRSITRRSALARDQINPPAGRAQARSYGVLLLLSAAALVATDATAGDRRHGSQNIEYARVVDVEPLIRVVHTEVPV